MRNARFALVGKALFSLCSLRLVPAFGFADFGFGDLKSIATAVRSVQDALDIIKPIAELATQAQGSTETLCSTINRLFPNS